MAWNAAASFHTVDRILSQPDPAATLRIKMLGRPEARLLMRYEISELNRDGFELWETAQLALGGLFFFFLLFGTAEGKTPLILALMAVLLVLVQRFFLTPEMAALGRLTDFAPAGTAVGDRAKFQVLHGTYIGVEALKWAVQLAIAAVLVSGRPSRSRYAGQQLDMVDKTDYRHIDR